MIGAILITFSLWNQPSKEEIEARKRSADSLELVKQKEVALQKQLKTTVAAATTTIPDSLLNDSTISADSLLMVEKINRYGAFADASDGKETFYTLENELLKITFTNRGGRVFAAELKKYKTYDQKPLVLFQSDSTVFGLNFFAQNRTISTNQLFF